MEPYYGGYYPWWLCLVLCLVKLLAISITVLSGAAACMGLDLGKVGIQDDRVSCSGSGCWPSALQCCLVQLLAQKCCLDLSLCLVKLLAISIAVLCQLAQLQ